MKASGGSRSTSLSPPVGTGWGHNKPEFQVVPGSDGEVLVYCTVQCWHTDRMNTFYGVGGDKVVTKQSSRMFNDDEAFKKAFTDAGREAPDEFRARTPGARDVAAD